MSKPTRFASRTHDIEALIVAHGQPGDPEPAQAAIELFAKGVARHLPGAKVIGATLAAPQALDAALARFDASPIVYPMFMTNGWFISSELPRRLAGRAAKMLTPLGMEPSLSAISVEIISETLGAKGWDAAETTLLVASHGSGRSRNSAIATERFAKTIGEITHFADIRTGYIEESPFLADAARGLAAQSICLPFFAARGGHVVEDIPEALDAAEFAGVLLDPIGTHDSISALVASTLQTHSQVELQASG